MSTPDALVRDELVILRNLVQPMHYSQYYKVSFFNKLDGTELNAAQKLLGFYSPSYQY